MSAKQLNACQVFVFHKFPFCTFTKLMVRLSRIAINFDTKTQDSRLQFAEVSSISQPRGGQWALRIKFSHKSSGPPESPSHLLFVPQHLSFQDTNCSRASRLYFYPVFLFSIFSRHQAGDFGGLLLRVI